jgi:hypothetical protein
VLETETYLPRADDCLTAEWLKRMAELGMECEIHPEFSFETQTGFLPFKLRLNRSRRNFLHNKDFLTGFEFYRDSFDHRKTIVKKATEGGLRPKLFKWRTPPQYLVNAAIDTILRKCRFVLTFRWGSADTFELRLVSVSSLVLAEITGGISYYPADDIWYDSQTAVLDGLTEVEKYEASLSEPDFKVHPFEGWK